MSAKKALHDAPPKKVAAELGRLGDGYAWLERKMVDWGDGVPKETFVPGQPDGAFVLGFLDDGKIPLVHQYRLFNGGWSYELPGGIIDETDSPEDAALRELEEEAGYRAAEIEPLLSYWTNSGLRCRSSLFVARKLVKTKQDLDDGERELEVVLVTPTHLWEMVMDGTITHAATIIATLLAKERGFLKIERRGLKKAHPF